MVIIVIHVSLGEGGNTTNNVKEMCAYDIFVALDKNETLKKRFKHIETIVDDKLIGRLRFIVLFHDHPSTPPATDYLRLALRKVQNHDNSFCI